MIAGGHFDEAAVRGVLESGAHPARNPEQNIADLKAQAAACAKGAAELARICAQYGADVVTAYMGHVQDNAEEEVRQVIGALKDGDFAMPMDGGMEIHVAITVDRDARSARIDFTGTSEQQPNNLNAPGSVTKAAVLYVFRCLVAERHSDECRLPEAARDRGAGRLAFEPAPARGGGRRQCRDQPGRGRCAVRRAGRDGGGAGHDEQPDLRQ